MSDEPRDDALFGGLAALERWSAAMPLGGRGLREQAQLIRVGGCSRILQQKRVRALRLQRDDRRIRGLLLLEGRRPAAGEEPGIVRQAEARLAVHAQTARQRAVAVDRSAASLDDGMHE